MHTFCVATKALMMKVILTQNPICQFEQDRLEARLDAACAAYASSTATFSGRPALHNSFRRGQEPTFTWAGGEDIPSTPGPETGGEDIEEIYLYGSSVTPSFYEWNGPRYHCNTGTWSRRTEEARFNSNKGLVFATKCP